MNQRFGFLKLLFLGLMLIGGAYGIYAVSAPLELQHYRMVREAQRMAAKAESFRHSKGRYPMRRDISLGLFQEKDKGPFFSSEDGRTYAIWALVQERDGLHVISYDSRKDEWEKYR